MILLGFCLNYLACYIFAWLCLDIGWCYWQCLNVCCLGLGYSTHYFPFGWLIWALSFKLVCSLLDLPVVYTFCDSVDFGLVCLPLVCVVIYVGL